MSVLEFVLPANSENRNTATYTMELSAPNPPATVPFVFTFFDDRVELTCAGGCAAKSAAAAALRVSVSNLNVTDDGGIESVSFSGQPAAAFSVDATASSASLTVLSVTPPASVTCDYAPRFSCPEHSSCIPLQACI
jgi:hypothetical protein